MKPVVATFILILLFSVYAQSEIKPSPYSFLTNTYSARGAGIGGAGVSFANDIGGVLVNPALLGVYEGNNFSTTFFKQMLDINTGNVIYILDNGDSSVFAFGANYTNYGSFDYYDEMGNAIGGSFTGNLVSLNASYANYIGSNLYGGVTLKLAFNQLEKATGFAFAVDAGVLYKFTDERTNIGFSILNAGTELKTMYGENYGVPMDVKLGFSHRLKGLPLYFNFGFNHLNDNGKFFSRFGNVNIGGELYFGEYVQVRIGFVNYIRRNLAAAQNKGLTGLSAGAGIVTNIINVDYGLQIYTPQILLHRIGINFKL